MGAPVVGGIEELDRIRIGRAEEDHRAGLVSLVARDHEQVVELLVDLEAGLVDGGEDGLAGLGQILQQIDDRLGVVGGQAGGGLVEKQHRRVGDELQGDVDALALAAAEGLLFRRADDGVDLVGNAQVVEHFFGAGVDLGVGQVGAQAGGEVERLADGQLGMDDVVLGHVAHHVAVEVVVVVEALAAEEHRALHRAGVAVERLEQGGLAGAGRTHQRHQFIGKDGERDGVQQALAVGRVDHDVLGLDGDLAVVVALRQFAVFQQLEADAAQADLLARPWPAPCR